MPYKKRKKREKRSNMKGTGESMEALGAKHFPLPAVPPALPTPDEFPWGSKGSKSFYFLSLSLSVAEIKGMPCLHAYISAAVIVVLCTLRYVASYICTVHALFRVYDLCEGGINMFDHWGAMRWKLASLYHDCAFASDILKDTYRAGMLQLEPGKLWSTCRGSRIFWQSGRSANMQKRQSALPFFGRKRSWHGTFHVTRNKQPSRLLCCVRSLARTV